MSCSFCYFTGHKVTTCQSTTLLELMESITLFVETLKTKPLTSVHSRALTLHTRVNEFTLNESKGVASKLGIKITGKNKSILNSCIVKDLWFDKQPNLHIMSISENNYFANLNRIISGVNSMESWTQYILKTRDTLPTILEENRLYNLNRMRVLNRHAYYDDMIEINIAEFINIVSSLITVEGLTNEFGSNITLEDVCQIIRVMRIFFQRNNDDILDLDTLIYDTMNFGDVILTQNLNLTCEFVNDFEKSLDECPICISDKCDTMLNCGHMFCIDCIVTTVTMAMNDHKKKLTCALCRTDTTVIKSIDEVKIDNLAHLLI